LLERTLPHRYFIFELALLCRQARNRSASSSSAAAREVRKPAIGQLFTAGSWLVMEGKEVNFILAWKSFA
jgi:hypothetical protein